MAAQAAVVQALAEAADPEAAAVPVGVEVPAPAEVCGTQARPQVEVVAAEELVRVVEAQEAADKVPAKAPAVAQELAAVGAEPVEVAERVPAVRAVLAAEPVSVARVDREAVAPEVDRADPAREAAGAVLVALVEAPVEVDPEAAARAEVPAGLEALVLAAEARLAVEVQQPSPANG